MQNRVGGLLFSALLYIRLLGEAMELWNV
jgi:hypothetical protein